MELYTNPIINSDYSDPDVIRVGDDFFMIASSFNHTPGVPILHSKDLVNWEIINYVFERIPFEKFNDVHHGHGAWAPAIRYHNETFYVVIPFVDEGIYISSTKDIYGKWSDLWCLIDDCGIIDPCPIWDEDKCYLAVAFAKSRKGFNSMIGLYEVSPDLKIKKTDYQIVYDGHNDNPTIEGPKLYKHDDYYYIMAPAGSVKTGWQTCLRSKNIYGPYESKIVQMQNDTPINGPHQGALVDYDGKFAFIHFQDKGCLGRVICLQPVTWIDDWPICGDVRDERLAGSPFVSHEYLLEPYPKYNIPTCDDFKNKISLVWQTPANKIDNLYEVNDCLKLYCINKSLDNLGSYPYTFLQKLIYDSFIAQTRVVFDLNENDETGLCVMGSKYAYISFKKINSKVMLYVKEGSFDGNDSVVYEENYNSNEADLNIIYDNNSYYFCLNGKKLPFSFKAYPGRWIGTKIGIFARGENNGYAKYSYFDVKKINK